MDSNVIARSLKGHAATSGVDKWVAIQENTFRNWVNEQLKMMDMEVNNLEEDFDNGIRLCALIEALQGKRIRVIKNPRNHHQQLANVAEALTAIANDNIRLVNIGKILLKACKYSSRYEGIIIHIIIFLFLLENICCWYSLEVPRWGTSNEYDNKCFHG